MDQNLKSTAERTFKKQQKEADASQAWKEHLAHQKSVDANMMRLRNERLEREAQAKSSTKKRKRSA